MMPSEPPLTGPQPPEIPTTGVRGAVTNRAFLEAVFGPAWEGAHVTAFSSDPSSDGERSRWGGNLARRILDSFGERENQYYVVSLFTQDYVAQQTGRATRRKAQFASMHLVLVDDVTEGALGDGKKVEAANVLEKMGEPSFRLETSPGNQQWGYIFDVPIFRRAEAEHLVSEMIARGLTADGVDPGMAGVTRYVRLPGGTNRKAKYGPHGFKCRLVSWQPERKFEPARLAAAWGINLAAAIDEADFARAREEARPKEPITEWQSSWTAQPSESREHAAKFALEDLAWNGLTGSSEEDPLVLGLRRLRLIKERRGLGMYELTCPFLESHTGRANNGTAYLPGGGIACHHGHCVRRTREEYAGRVAGQLRRLRVKTPSDEMLIRMLTPWQPRAYDAHKLKDLVPLDEWFTKLDTFEIPANGVRSAAVMMDIRTVLSRCALTLMPYVRENRADFDTIYSNVAEVVERRQIPLEMWRREWKRADQLIPAHKERRAG